MSAAAQQPENEGTDPSTTAPEGEPLPPADTRERTRAEGLRVRLVRLTGLDFHIVLTLLLRGWGIAAGLVMVLLVPLWFTSVQQGYYFTFSSLLAMQIFFELGMSQVIVQLVAHEMAHLAPGVDGTLRGPISQLDRLTSLLRLLRRWYDAVTLLFAVGVGLAGFVFFDRRGEMPIGAWAGPWCLLVLASAANLRLSSSLAVLEGAGQVGHVARIRLRQSILGSALMWLAMSCGAGLWAIPLLPWAAAVTTAVWLRRQDKTLRWLLSRPLPTVGGVRWRTDIFPFQWRIAVSWVSGYFIFQLMVPLVFAHQGAVEAGRLGMALNIFTALLSVGMSWVSAKVPSFAHHIALSERAALNALFVSVFKRSIAFTLLACLGVLCTVQLAATFDLGFVRRLPPFPVLVCLAVVALANNVVFAAATFMRAHREEPMLLPSLFTGLAVLLAAYYGARIGVLTTVVLYAAVTLTISLPWTAAIFLRYYRRAG